MQIRIFSFHRVSPEDDELWQPLYPSTFRNILEYIVANYKVVNLDKFLLSEHKEPADRPYAGITFDDGYKDVLTHAYPMIKEYNIPFNVFAVTDCVNTGLPPWTFVLDYLFVHSGIMKNKVADILPPAFRVSEWKDQRSRIEYAKRMKPFLKSSANDYRVKVVQAFIDNFNDVEVPRDLLLTWEDLIYLKEQGVNISSHSHTHPLLGKMEKEASIVSEFKTSFDILTRKLGEPPVSISYPVGSVDERVKKIAQEVGYKIGFAVNQCEYDSDKYDLFEIPRIELYNESLFKTKLRAEGVIQNVKRYFYLNSPNTYH